MLAGLPWTVIGDFNQTLFTSEHSSMSQPSSSSAMRAFTQCLARVALSDLPYCGNTFTWTNKHTQGIVAKKLDRILVNDEWFSAFPNSVGVFGDPGISDHSPCCVFTDSLRPKSKSHFKFFSHLNKHPEFPQLISVYFHSLPFDATRMLCVSKKLKELKSVIRQFSKKNFSDIEKRVAEAFSYLQTCQHNVLQSPSPAAASCEQAAHHKWLMLARAEVCKPEEAERKSGMATGRGLKYSFLSQISRLKTVPKSDESTPR